jgi:GNAT superfamily N-acetyltransferase
MNEAPQDAASDVVEHRRGQFVISTDPELLDLDLIHGFLTNCYWAKGIPREVVARSIEHSLCFGIYDEGKENSRLKPKTGLNGAPAYDEGEENSPCLAKDARHGAPQAGGGERIEAPPQVGFARVISDFATFAYIADVFVIEAHRGRGLGKMLMECIKEHPKLQGLRRWNLCTADAHGLYSQFGFTAPKWPERYLEILRLDVYETK